MKKAEKITTSFPDPMASNEEKLTLEYGLKVAKAIAHEWFDDNIIQDDCEFSTRSRWIQKMRLYARAKQDLLFYQNLISRQDEDLTYLNLDWRPQNEAGKYVNLVANGIDDKYYRLNITAIDRLSTEQKGKYKESLEKAMYSRKLVQNTEKVLGLDVRETGYIAKNEDELELHLNTTYKPKQEIAEELLIQYVFDTNKWFNIHQKYRRDLVTCGLGVIDCKTDNTDGVTINYVDIENFIHSYSNDNSFDDRRYGGVVREITILDIQREGVLSDREIREIIVKNAGRNVDSSSARDYADTRNIRIKECLHHVVHVLDFDFKTSKRTAYKKQNFSNGNFKLQRRSSDFKMEKTTQKHEAISKTLDTWFEGTYVIGSDVIYNWKESENVATDTLNRAKGRFIVRAPDIYKNKLHSFLEDIIPNIDQIHVTKLKLQHIIAEIKPGGAEIDMDMLANLSGGEQVDYKEIISIFNAKGIVFKKRIADEFGNIKEGRAVEEIHNGIPANLLQLLQVLQHQKQELRDITGINPSRDGTQPANALVGIQQAQLIASNMMTQHIADASMYLKLDTAEIISTRISDIFRFKKEAAKIIKVYEKAIGKLNLDILEEVGPIHLHEFGFTMELLPSHEEMSHFEESMKIALNAGKIDEDDILDAREMAKKNPKYASQFLKIRKKQRAEDEMKRREAEASMKSQNDIASNTAASQNRTNELKAQTGLDIEKAKALATIEVEKQFQLNKVNEPIRQQEYNLEAYKKQMDIAGTMNLKRFDNDEKLKRQSQNNTDQSKMVDQRKKGSGPIDFTQSDFDKLLQQ